MLNKQVPSFRFIYTSGYSTVGGDPRGARVEGGNTLAIYFIFR